MSSEENLSLASWDLPRRQTNGSPYPGNVPITGQSRCLWTSSSINPDQLL